MMFGSCRLVIETISANRYSLFSHRLVSIQTINFFFELRRFTCKSVKRKVTKIIAKEKH